MDMPQKQDAGRLFTNFNFELNSFRVARLASAFVAILVGVGGLNRLQAQQRVGSAATNKWDVLEGCRLVETGWRDGDSFHVRYRDREYVFRLHFVDAPETDNTEPARVEDQAAYFGVTPEQVMEVGRDASRFTADKLKTDLVDLNDASIGELMALPGVGKKLAERIIANRPFQSVDDLKKLKGFGGRTVEGSGRWSRLAGLASGSEPRMSWH